MGYVVESLTVSSEYRCWNPIRGMTTSGQISMVVKPPEDEGPWDPAEASKVALQVRRRLQLFLIADADARQVELPDNGVDAIERYNITLKTMTSGEVSNEVMAR